MHSHALSYESVREQLENFAEIVPRLLAAHPKTADLAEDLGDLTSSAESPFTVAVVGQMRVGKSTLLNALIGQDLAITGVNETTATLNWLKYGSGELVDKFRVVWKDKPEEWIPRERISEWVGDSGKARATRYLEFYAEAEFLKRANFVDTPGMRSVIESHEETINEFLANKWDRESQHQGGKADAIVYVFPGVAHATDQSRLKDFSEARIPGSSPANSIGVLHKWDSIKEEDPFSVMRARASALMEAMQGLIAGIIPVSAPLYIAATRHDETFWLPLSQLVGIENDDTFEDLLIDDYEFSNFESSSVAVSTMERKKLLKHIPWASLRMILRHGRRLKIDDPDRLRDEILNRSGVPELQRQLEKRFFARSQLIKVMSIIGRAWAPCEKASIRLRNEALFLGTSIERIPALKTAVEQATAITEEHRKELEGVIRFLDEQAQGLKQNLSKAEVALDAIDRERGKVRDLFDSMDADWKCLELLETDAAEALPKDLHTKLSALFGMHGPELECRLRPWTEAACTDSEAVIEKIHTTWNTITRLQNNPTLRLIASHGGERIGEILEYLEASNPDYKNGRN